MMRDRLSRGQQLAPTLTLPRERRRESRAGSTRSLLRFNCALVPRKRRREISVGFFRSYPCEHEREWEPQESASELFLLTLLRLRGRAGEGAHADEVIR